MPTQQAQQTLLTSSTSLTGGYQNGVSNGSLMFNPLINSINNTNSIAAFQNGSLNNISIGSLNVTTITAQSGTIGNFQINENTLVSNNGNLVFDAVNDEIIVSFNGTPQILITGAD